MKNTGSLHPFPVPFCLYFDSSNFFVEGLSEGLVDVSEAFITTKAESYSAPSLQDKQIS
ncbi:Uncharacterised protein [Neisseria gonorrhoeae]|uniref:Uncharacterized protein n=1 Tax=Neisseria gonorrhoeae TaxID=485 RepID=A0A378VX21_NEIGO|nr:Uncharacterised protein [Neisseria gonorrhoeae]